MKVHEVLHAVFNTLQTNELFYGHGIDSAWDEAVALVLTVLALPIDSGDEVLELWVSPLQWASIQSKLHLRVQLRKPMAYVLQQAWFMDLSFYVDERVLIPRSPFAEWISYAFAPWVIKDRVKRILEIGTGSGCMAIAAAMVFYEALVDAVDISMEALLVAQHNVQMHQLDARVCLIQSDCFSALTPAHQYDLIISNPPYVSQEEIDLLPAEYQHEPIEQALYADDEGMSIVDAILHQAHHFLSHSGVLVVEVGYSDDIFMARYPKLPITWLECASGGQGLFLITRQLLEDYFEA